MDNYWDKENLPNHKYDVEGIGIITGDNVYLEAYASKLPIPDYKFAWWQLEIGESTYHKFNLSGNESIVKITRIE